MKSLSNTTKIFIAVILIAAIFFTIQWKCNHAKDKVDVKAVIAEVKAADKKEIDSIKASHKIYRDSTGSVILALTSKTNELIAKQRVGDLKYFQSRDSIIIYRSKFRKLLSEKDSAGALGQCKFILDSALDKIDAQLFELKHLRDSIQENSRAEHDADSIIRSGYDFIIAGLDAKIETLQKERQDALEAKLIAENKVIGKKKANWWLKLIAVLEALYIAGTKLF